MTSSHKKGKYPNRSPQPKVNRTAAARTPAASLRIAYIGERGIIGRYSGIESYYEETGSRLAQSGHGVTAYCRSHFTPAVQQYKGIRIVRLPTIQSKHLETLIRTLLSTIHACFSQYDIVHYHTLGPSLFSFLPRLFGKKTIVRVPGLDWQRKKWGWFARRILKLADWASAKLPDKTIVVSRVLQNYYGSRYSRQPIYMPNGTHPRERQNRGHLAMLGLAPNGYVLFLGRFSPEKNCHLLIEAFECTSTALKLVFAGAQATPTITLPACGDMSPVGSCF
jgi:glycosyltransferase involved in cell wall biosynthesis